VSFAKAADLLKLAMSASGRRGVCLSEIESEYGCVRRTAQRMVEALQQVFPQSEHYVGDDGRHCWRIPARAIAALLSPTADELAALDVAILELERVGAAPEAGKLRDLDRKVHALVPPESGLRLATDEEALLEAMGYAARPGPRPRVNPDVDDAIAEALKGPLHLTITYRSRAEDVPSERTVAPFGLLLGARRYLVARDLAKDDGKLRHYRVEDIISATLRETTFEVPADFDFGEYARRAFGSYYEDREYQEVVWRFSPHAAERARRFVFHPLQVLEDEADGSLIVRFTASGHLEMCWHLYAWGDAVEVLAPPALAALVNSHRRSDFASLP
jgi:predicted DNA-binding transcriptional regulator YafY